MEIPEKVDSGQRKLYIHHTSSVNEKLGDDFRWIFEERVNSPSRYEREQEEIRSKNSLSTPKIKKSSEPQTLSQYQQIESVLISQNSPIAPGSRGSIAQSQKSERKSSHQTLKEGSPQMNPMKLSDSEKSQISADKLQKSHESERNSRIVSSRKIVTPNNRDSGNKLTSNQVSINNSSQSINLSQTKISNKSIKKINNSYTNTYNSQATSQIFKTDQKNKSLLNSPASHQNPSTKSIKSNLKINSNAQSKVMSPLSQTSNRFLPAALSTQKKAKNQPEKKDTQSQHIHTNCLCCLDSVEENNQTQQFPFYQNIKVNTINRDSRGKFLMAVLRLRMLLRFFRCVRLSMVGKRIIVMKIYKEWLPQEAISDAMNLSLSCMHEPLLKLYEEPENLRYSKFSSTTGEQVQFLKGKKQKLESHVEQILVQISYLLTRFLRLDSPLIQLLEFHVGHYNFLLDNFFPEFLIDRLDFKQTGEVRKMSRSQREKVALYFFIVYGVLNRLVEPWISLGIEPSPIRIENSRLISSVIFYSLIDFIQSEQLIHRPDSPRLQNKFLPKPSGIELHSYVEEMKPAWGKLGFSEMSNGEHHHQSIIKGVRPRQEVEESINDLRPFFTDCFFKISARIMSKIDSVRPIQLTNWRKFIFV